MGTRQYSRQTLASYALFDNARRNGRPPQHALVPLVLPFLAGKAGQQFKPDALAQSLQQIFGPNFTGYSAEALSKGLCDEGYLREESGGQEGAVFFFTEKVSELNVDESVSEAEGDIDTILVEFFDFLTATAPLIKLNYNLDEWKDLFIRWATTVDISDKDGLREWVDGFIANEKKGKVSLEGNMEVEERFFGIDRHIVVLFASFAKWLYFNRSDLFAKLVTLAEIGFLIDLVSELREPVRGAPKTINLTVVLDGPVVLDALGLMGAGRQQAAKSMLELCSKNGIKVIVLQHSVEEAREIVRAVLAKAAPARYGLVADTLRQDRLAERRATNFLSKPDQDVQSLGIQILNADINSSYVAKSHFDDATVKDLAGRLPYFDGFMGQRRLRDAKSVGFVMRRRSGHYTSDMYDARYLMLTRSVSLALGSRSYIAKNLAEVPTYAVPPVLEVRHFSTMFLLAFGTSDGEKISRGELLSSCEMVLKTSPRLLKKVRDTVEQLSLFTKEELDAVMMDPVALYEVTTVTGNDPEVVSIDTAEALARIMREAAAKDERIRHQKEFRRTSEQHIQDLAKIQDERESARLAAATSNLHLQNNHSEARGAAKVLLDAWYGEARFIWAAVVVGVFALSALAVTGVFIDIVSASLWIRIAVAASILLLAVYTLGNRLIDKFSFLNFRKFIRRSVVNAKLKQLPEGLLSSAISELRDD